VVPGSVLVSWQVAAAGSVLVSWQVAGCWKRQTRAAMEFRLPHGLEFPSYVDELKAVVAEVQPARTVIPLIRGHLSRFVDGADMDLVAPGLYLGDCDAALNKAYLVGAGVTHVLNAAANLTRGPAPVRTGAEYYQDAGLRYLGLDLIDLPFADVARHFQASADFIDGALEAGGTVLVHCRQGRSRSASVVAAWLMLRRRHTAAAALTLLRRHREVRPNNGFLAQLADLDLKLFRARLQKLREETSSSSSEEEILEQQSSRCSKIHSSDSQSSTAQSISYGTSSTDITSAKSSDVECSSLCSSVPSTSSERQLSNTLDDSQCLPRTLSSDSQHSLSSCQTTSSSRRCRSTASRLSKYATKSARQRTSQSVSRPPRVERDFCRSSTTEISRSSISCEVSQLSLSNANRVDHRPPLPPSSSKMEENSSSESDNDADDESSENGD